MDMPNVANQKINKFLKKILTKKEEGDNIKKLPSGM